MTSIYDYLSKDLYVISDVKANPDGSSTVQLKSQSGAGTELQSENIVSGVVDGNLSFVGGFIQSFNFVSGTSGWRLSASGTLEAVNAILSGSITASSGAIGGFSIGSDYMRDAANSFGLASTVSASNDVRFWAGATYANRATAPFRIFEDGNVSAIGLSTLNMKAYTNFEASGRFVLTGDVAPTFGNNGMVVAPGAAATHYARALWWITNNVFNNNPTFTCSLFMLSVGSGDAVGFVGLGLPTITGSGMTETGKNYCGFEFKKTSGVLTVIALQCDGSGTVTFSGTLQTLTVNDSLELFIKINSSSIDYYTRLNGASISAVTTLSATMPSGSENYISFVVSNKGSANDMQLQLQCAALEH